MSCLRVPSHIGDRSILMKKGERGRHRQRDRRTDKHRERDRDRETERDRDRQTEKETGRQRQRRETERQTGKQTEKERDRQRQIRDWEAFRQTNRQTDRDRDTQREAEERQTDRDFPNYLTTAQPPVSTEGEKQNSGWRHASPWNTWTGAGVARLRCLGKTRSARGMIAISRRSTQNHQLFWPTQDLMMMSWCLMSSDVSWHIRDKLWPMPKHGSINLYVHGNQKAR